MAASSPPSRWEAAFEAPLCMFLRTRAAVSRLRGGKNFLSRACSRPKPSDRTRRGSAGLGSKPCRSQARFLVRSFPSHGCPLSIKGSTAAKREMLSSIFAAGRRSRFVRARNQKPQTLPASLSQSRSARLSSSRWSFMMPWPRPASPWAGEAMPSMSHSIVESAKWTGTSR